MMIMYGEIEWLVSYSAIHVEGMREARLWPAEDLNLIPAEHNSEALPLELTFLVPKDRAVKVHVGAWRWLHTLLTLE
jgi:hypothetical protein